MSLQLSSARPVLQDRSSVFVCLSMFMIVSRITVIQSADENVPGGFRLVVAFPLNDCHV